MSHEEHGVGSFVHDYERGFGVIPQGCGTYAHALRRDLHVVREVFTRERALIPKRLKPRPLTYFNLFSTFGLHLINPPPLERLRKLCGTQICRTTRRQLATEHEYRYDGYFKTILACMKLRTANHLVTPSILWQNRNSHILGREGALSLMPPESNHLSRLGDRELVQLYKQDTDEPSVQRELFDRCLRKIRVAISASRIVPPFLVDDAVSLAQECVLRNICDLKAGDKLNSWLIQIARNAAITIRRNHFGRGVTERRFEPIAPTEDDNSSVRGEKTKTTHFSRCKRSTRGFGTIRNTERASGRCET